MATPQWKKFINRSTAITIFYLCALCGLLLKSLPAFLCSMFNRKGSAMNDHNRKEFQKNECSPWRPQEALRFNVSFSSVCWISLVLSGLFLSSASGVPTVSTNRGPYMGGNIIVITNISPGSGTDITNVTVCGVQATNIQGRGPNWVSLILGPYGSGLGNIVIQSTSGGPTVMTNAYTYNPAGVIGMPTLSWEEAVGLPTGRQFLAAATLGSNLYAIGGWDGSVQANVYRYDETNWTGVVGLPAARYGLAATTLGTNLYAIGGLGTIGVQTNVYRYDETNWTGVVGLPAARYWLAATTLGSNLYAIGGRDGSDVRTNVYRYDGTNWTEIVGLPAARSTLAAATLGNNLYAIGGRDGSDVRTNVYRYDGTNWTEIVGLPAARSSLAAATLGSNLYAIGGRDDSDVRTNVYRYSETSWVEVASLPSPRFALAAATLGNNLYAIGGSDGDHPVRTNVYRSIFTAIGGVTPTNGPWDGGTTVTIIGVNLGDGDITNVTLCGISAHIQSQSATEVVVVTDAVQPPPSPLRLGDVRVYSVSYGETVKSNAFYYSAINLALAKRGSTITGSNGANWTNLIDGVTTGYSDIKGFGYTVWTSSPPGRMTLDLKGLCNISSMRLLLWDLDDRFYRYKIEASTNSITNNATWVTIIDRTGGTNQCQGWQDINSSSVTQAWYLRLTGTYNSSNEAFQVVEWEVYGPPAILTSTNAVTVPEGSTRLSRSSSTALQSAP